METTPWHARGAGTLVSFLLSAAVVGCGDRSSSSNAELWYAGAALCGLSHAQLEASAELSPAIVVSTSALKAFSDVALDSQGNVWVVGVGSDDVFRFNASALVNPGSLAPDLVVRSAALKTPGNLAFDRHGALWVVNRGPAPGGPDGEGSLVRFDVPADASGVHELQPTAQLMSSTAGDLFQPGSIAFDPAERLWVTSFAGLVRFDDPDQQVGQVALAPGAVVEKGGYPNNMYFYSVAFDADGGLWAASGDGLHHLTSVTAFKDVAALSGRSSPPSAVTITGDEDLLPAGGLAFDVSGDLWMATGGSIVMYSNPGALSGATNPVPAITLGVTGQAAPTTNTHLILFPAHESSGQPAPQ